METGWEWLGAPRHDCPIARPQEGRVLIAWANLASLCIVHYSLAWPAWSAGKMAAHFVCQAQAVRGASSQERGLHGPVSARRGD